jgi:hypothetical protein
VLMGDVLEVFFLVNANCFVPVCSVVTSKTIINVHWEGREVSGDGRQRQML